MNVMNDPAESPLQRFMAAARTAGVKLTHQRLEIYAEVASSVEHPDARAVFRAVQARMPTVSLDTVYRTLWMLNDLGLITTLGPRREGVRFDANLAHHHHYVCVRCGMARDFESAELDALRVPDGVKELGSVVAAQVEVRGVCSRCASEPAEGSAPRSPVPSNGHPRRTK
jgi:Fur family transcriptional regulator, peroxide stress response regulator